MHAMTRAGARQEEDVPGDGGWASDSPPTSVSLINYKYNCTNKGTPIKRCAFICVNSKIEFIKVCGNNNHHVYYKHW